MIGTFKAVAVGLLTVGIVVSAATNHKPVSQAVTATPGPPPVASNHIVTQGDIDRWKVELSNWGRWGKDDQEGALNLITPAKRKEAAALVREGFAVSLSHNIFTERAEDVSQPVEDKLVGLDASSSRDMIVASIHGLANTHLDSLAHHFYNGKMYNGYPQSEYVTMEKAATKNSVINSKDGIFTRGILVDLPRLKGVEYLEPGTPIYMEDLVAWENKTGTKISAGDALFIRTGRWVRRAKLGPWNLAKSAAGLDASVIPWLKQKDVAVIGSESALSVVPNPPSTQITGTDDALPVHNFAIVALGVTVVDDMDFDRLSAACAARNRWSFLATMALPNGTGSLINPTALF